MKLVVVIFIGYFCVYILSAKSRFDNYRVYSVAIKSKEHLKWSQQLEEINDGYSMWNNPVIGGDLDILVPPHKFGEFEDILEVAKITSTVKIWNLQELIDNEEPKYKLQNGEMEWTSYHTLDDIYAWLDKLESQYPTILRQEIVGTSYQGREIRAIKLSHKEGNKVIMIEANIHAREWITSATATWVLNELLTSTDPETKNLAENIDWYIVPVLNTDGFNYTKTTNRLWRKTRYPHTNLCYGADGNRNFDFQWLTIGASDNPCSDTYAGPQPFSESETRSMANFYIKYKSQVVVYLAFHSYSQIVLLPYGHTSEGSENHQELMQIGNATATAIYQRYHTEYKVGSSSVVLYYNSGTSQDWVKGVHNSKVSFTIEFRDKGKYGFILPPEQIVENAEEIFDGLKALVQECKMLGYL